MTAAASLLSPNEIEARLAVASVAYLPLGSLEFHGPHLPIGLDALTAQGICLAAAERTGGIVLPAVHTAIGGEHTRYPWTLLAAAPQPIEVLLTETLDRLQELGVHRIVLLSGHFAAEQRDMLDRVADAFNARAVSARAIARTLGQVPSSPVPPDHAARFESLILQALEPGLVHIDRLPDIDTQPAPAGEDPFGQNRHSPDHPLQGIFGPDPRRAEPADGALLLDYLVSWVAELPGADMTSITPTPPTDSQG